MGSLPPPFGSDFMLLPSVPIHSQAQFAVTPPCSSRLFCQSLCQGLFAQSQLSFRKAGKAVIGHGPFPDSSPAIAVSSYIPGSGMFGPLPQGAMNKATSCLRPDTSFPPPARGPW